MLTLRQLACFMAIIEEANITRAAERLHVSPTAVSLQIKVLEDRLGVALLVRHSRGVTPTPNGEDLYARARTILELVAETERAVSKQNIAPKRVRIGVTPSVARVIGVEAMLAASRLKDGVILQVAEGWSRENLADLRQGSLDLAVGYGIEPAPDLRVIELFEERFVFASARSVAQPGETISIERALASSLVFYGERSISWRVAKAAAQARGLDVNITHEVESIGVWRDLLLRGLGAVISPFSAVADECRRGEVVVQDIEGDPISARLTLAMRGDEHGRSLPEGFVAFISRLIIDIYSARGPYYRPVPHGPSVVEAIENRHPAHKQVNRGNTLSQNA